MYDATLAAVLLRARNEATEAVVGADARVQQAEQALQQGLAEAERRIEEAEQRADLMERQARSGIAPSESASRSRQAQDLADGVTRAAPIVPDMVDLLEQAAPLTRHLDALFGRSGHRSDE